MVNGTATHHRPCPHAFADQINDPHPTSADLFQVQRFTVTLHGRLVVRELLFVSRDQSIKVDVGVEWFFVAAIVLQSVDFVDPHNQFVHVFDIHNQLGGVIGSKTNFIQIA